MGRSAVSKVMWRERASRAPLYALGVVVAVMLALLLGALSATSAQAETITVDNSGEDLFRPPPPLHHCRR